MFEYIKYFHNKWTRSHSLLKRTFFNLYVGQCRNKTVQCCYWNAARVILTALRSNFTVFLFFLRLCRKPRSIKAGRSESDPLANPSQHAQAAHPLHGQQIPARDHGHASDPHTALPQRQHLRGDQTETQSKSAAARPMSCCGKASAALDYSPGTAHQNKSNLITTCIHY